MVCCDILLKRKYHTFERVQIMQNSILKTDYLNYKADAIKHRMLIR